MIGEGKGAYGLEPRIKAENFMRGAFFITAGGLISRMLGVLFRPVGQAFLGDQGLGLVNAPNYAYQIMLAIAATGLNVAISRLVSERLAVEDYLGARHVFRVATKTLLISGAVFSLLFGLSAHWLAASQKVPEAWIGFVVLSPAIFLVTLECAFRGLYQGMQQMMPSAVSQVVEQVGRVGVGLVLVAVFSRVALNYGAAGLNGGNTAGVLLGAFYGGWIYFRDRPTVGWTTTAPGVESLENASTWSLLTRIFSIAMPLSLVGAVMPVMGFIDSSIVTDKLEALGLTHAMALEAQSYLANAGQLRDLPPILTTALYVSLVPAVTEALARGRTDQARYRAAIAFRLTFLIGIPATVGLLVGAKDAYEVMYKGTGYTVMAALAWSTLSLMVQQTSSGVLQGMGLIWISVRNILLGVLVKTVLTFWWAGLPGVEARGAAYATVVGFGLTALLNLWSLHRTLGLGIQLKQDIGLPTLASLAMGLGIWLVSPVSHHFIHWDRLAGLTTILTGALIYLVVIFVVGGVREADLHLIPGVTMGMIAGLRRRRLLRD